MLSTLKPGTVVDSRYEIVAHVGDGGMGSVFKARELGLERFVALKMLHPGLIGDKEHQDRFKREGSVLSKLEHPHILQCYRFGVWNGMYPYIAMEYVTGVTLSALIDEFGRLDPARVLTIGAQTCSAMEHAHKCNVAHRDLKPANIMVLQVDGADCVKVLDFGLAKVLPDAGRESQHLTQTGALIGSVNYMSPEQCVGKKADRRSDIYSLGCVLYEALSGAPPLVADTPVGLIYLHAHSYPEPLKQLPQGLNEILMHSMAKDPADRFQTMAEFGEALSLPEAEMNEKWFRLVHRERRPKKVVSGKFLFLSVVGSCSIIMFALLCVARLKTGWENQSVEKELSSVAAPVVSRNLFEFGVPHFGIGVSRKQQLVLIRAWLKKYGNTPSDRCLAYSCLFDLADIPDEKEEAARSAIHSFRELAAKLQLGKKGNYGNSEVLFSALYHVRDPLIATVGYEGAISFIRGYAKLLPQVMQDRTMGALARRLHQGCLYEEEEMVLSKIEHPDPIDLLYFAECYYRQKKFSQARAKLRSFWKEMARSGDFTDRGHETAVMLLRMDRITEIDKLLHNCAAHHGARESSHAFWKALVLSNERKYQLADRCLDNAISSAPRLYEADFRRDLLPLALRNGEQGKLKVSAEIRKLVLLGVAACDIPWMSRVAVSCRNTDPRLSQFLFAKCQLLIERETQRERHLNGLPDRLAALDLIEALNETGRWKESQSIALRLLSSFSGQAEESQLRLDLAEAFFMIKRADLASEQIGLVINARNHSPRLDLNLLLARAALADSVGDWKAAVGIFESARRQINDYHYYEPEDIVQVLESYAAVCRSANAEEQSRLLLAEAEAILPQECRQPFLEWKPYLPRWSHRLGFREVWSKR